MTSCQARLGASAKAAAVGEIGVPVESFAVAAVMRQCRGQNLQRILAREAGMLCQIYLAHPAGAHETLDHVPGEHLAHGQRHSGNPTTSENTDGADRKP